MRSPPLPGVLFIFILKWKPIHGAPLTHGCLWEKEIVLIIKKVLQTTRAYILKEKAVIRYRRAKCFHVSRASNIFFFFLQSGLVI